MKNMNNSNKIVNPNNIPKYKVGDFIITRKNGIGRICDNPNFSVWLKNQNGYIIMIMV